MESRTAAIIAPKHFEHITPLPAPNFCFTGNRNTLSQHSGGENRNLGRFFVIKDIAVWIASEAASQSV
jgi:hypothetical protein